MKSKFKIILATMVGTTVSWVVIIAALLFLCGSKGVEAVVQFPNPGDNSLVEWQTQKGQFIIRLVSSNVTSSATSVLFSCTSRPPERIWFESLEAQPTKDK